MSIFTSIVSFELSIYRRFVTETTKDLKSKQQSLLADMEEKSNEISSKEFDEELNDYFENLADTRWLYEEIFNKNTYNPMLLTLFGMLEKRLNTLCFYHNGKIQSDIELNDLVGNGIIEKSKKYFLKVVKIDLKELDKEWKFIKTLQKLRNAVAHNDSVINNKSDKDLVRFIMKSESINYNDKTGEFILTDESMIIELMDVIESYLEGIDKRITDKYYNIRKAIIRKH